MRFPTIAIFLILPFLLISQNNAFGHTLTGEDCGNIGLQLDQMNDVCVSDLSIVCVISIHGDSIGGGFTNAGTDQFGNSCEEVHPSTDGFPLSPRNPLISFLFEIFEIILPFLLLLVLVIVVVIVIRRRRGK